MGSTTKKQKNPTMHGTEAVPSMGDNEAIFGTYTFLINESHVYVKLC